MAAWEATAELKGDSEEADGVVSDMVPMGLVLRLFCRNWSCIFSSFAA